MIERYIVEIIGECIPTGVNYLYGDVNEVVDKLKAMSTTAALIAKKYPCVVLFTDVEESRGNRSDVQSECTIPALIIVTATDKTYMAEQRLDLIKEQLQPIYEALLTKLSEHVAIAETDDLLIQHTKINRLSWGKSALFQERNSTIEFIDAIELRNLQITIKWKIC